MSIKKTFQLSIPIEDEEIQDTTSDWKDIIFLPFHPVWSCVLLLTVLLNASLAAYDISYLEKETNAIALIYHICEFFYFADIILIIMHRNYPHIRKRRRHKYKSLGFIVVNLASMVPVWEITHYLSIPDFFVEEDSSRNYFKLKCIIRLFRLIEFGNALTNKPGYHIVPVFTALYLVFLFMVGHFLSSIFYVMTFGETDGWIRHLKDHQFDRNSSFQWYLLTFALTSGSLLHNFPTLVFPETNKELVYYIWTLLVGFTLHMMVFVSNMISIFKKDNMNYFEFQTRFNKIIDLLNEWEVDDQLKSKTVDYYTVFWQKRQGLKDMPEMFHLLPTSLQKEVTVDIFWEALRHSHFFAKTDMSFKRSVSLVMKSEFLLKGDFLFRVDELKTKMVYIVTGVVQILSKEDDDSPIMSFSSGTLLGETGSLIATVSPANLRTATYCEIQTLYLTDLYKVLLNYPTIAKYIRKQLFNRLSIAKHESSVQREEKDSTAMIQAIREFWNDLWHSSVRKVQVARSKKHAQRIRADNLDLLSLSDDVELQVDSICVSGQCPFIMEPDTGFRRLCDIVIILAVVVQIYVVPKASFSHNRITEGEMATLFLMDVIYHLDIYLQISTAIQKGDGLTTDFKSIIVIRLKQLSFLVDLVGTLPFDYVVLIFSSNASLVANCKILRLLKVYKVIGILKYVQSLFVIDTRTVAVIKYVFFYTCSVYWLTCLMHSVAFQSKTSTDWYEYNLNLFPNISSLQNVITKDRYLASMLITITGYMNNGPTGFFFYALHNILFYLLVILCGHLLFTYGLCELTATGVSKYEDERASRTYLQTLLKEASQYRVDKMVQWRVLNFLSFHYTVREGCQIAGEEGIFSTAPIELSNEIVRHRIIPCLKKVPLFAEASDDLLRYIVAHSEIKLVPPCASILNSENKSEILYVVMRGYCKMESSLPGDHERGSTAILQAGSTFPFLETFHNAFSFLTVTTKTVAELLLIRTNIIMNAFQTYETDYGSFRQTLLEHRQVYGSILFRKGARLTLMRSAKKATKKGNVFAYDMHDIDDIQCNEEAYRLPFIKLGFWSGCRYLLMRKTISPKSWFYTVWEVFRCAVALIYALCAITMSTLIAHMMTRVGLRIFFSLLDLVCFIDIYVRLHCQYFNEKGVLVTHPLSTAKHYLYTSFIIDVISFVPVENLQLDEYIGKHQRNNVMICSMLFTRLLLLHRPLSGLTYLEEQYKGKRGLAMHMVKYFMIIVTAIAFCQTIEMLLLCQAEDIKLYCTEGNYTVEYDYIKHFMKNFYSTCMLFTVASTGNLLEARRHDKVILLCLIPMFLLRCAFMVSTTSKAIGGNIELTLYRDRMKSYIGFFKGAAVSDADIRSIVDHYEYVWKKSHGMNMHHVLKYFHPQLEQDMAFNLYSITMLRASLFQGEHFSLFQMVTPLLHRDYYTKDSKIIQCNDIQQKIFFVHEGSVGIYIANTQVCILESGGMFGCFRKEGVTRQTLTAIAKIHSTVLTVDSSLLHKALLSFPRSMERLSKANSFNYEYLKETLEVTKSTSIDSEELSHGLYDEFKPYFDKIYFMEDGPRYTALNYLVSVHLYPLGSMFVLAATFVNLQQPELTEVLSVIYTLDVIHLAMMLLKLNKIYLDPVSGRLVKDPYVIRKKYASTTFWLDFLTLIPFDIMSKSFTDNVFVHNLCRLSRSGRFIALVIYYYQCEERLTMKKHLKWTYMIYSNLFLIQLFACGWLLVACPDSKCYYNSERISMMDFKVVRENDTFSSVLLAYLFIVNMYTGACSIKSYPILVKEIIVACIIALITQYITTNLCSAYTGMVLVDQFNFSRYEVRYNRLSTYLQARNLSPKLYTKVSNYCFRLWQWQRGDWLPEMIQECPNSLKQNIMQLLYGKNLSNHFLFSTTHKDFLRQLIAHLERFVFTPGESIVEKGDSDCCMYFINKGEVDVFEIEGKVEKKMVQLRSGMSFGEVQGLFCISHQYSYRAGTVCEILVLKKNKWEYLLKWFPASREEINAKARLHNVVREDDVLDENGQI